MSFGFSVGDFIALIELANKIRKEFVDAPSQFKDLSNEVRSLSIILQDIEIVFSESDLTIQQQTDLREIVDGCLNVLQKVGQTLDKYSELNSDSKKIGIRVKRVWKRLKWEPEDIKELRSRVVANVTLLNAFQGKFVSQISLATKSGVDRLHERHDDRERHEEFQATLDWLTPVDYAPQQNDFIARRQEGTGQWLLDSIKFQTWLETEKQTLFCPGIPGAGKTILTSIVVEELTKRRSNDANIGIAYIYCNFRRQDEQKIDDLLASLLKQLAECRPSLPACVKDLYDRHKTKRTRPALDEILKALQSITLLFSRVFILIDALDECQVSHGCRTKFLSEIFGLQDKCGLQFFATSRFIPEILERFEESVRLDIRASNQDVQRYLDGHISQLSGCVLRSLELQEEIKVEIIKAVDGMFLLAQLQLDSLKGKKSPKAIRNALKVLPTGSEAYDNAYKDAMERIEGQLTEEEELAKQVLSWITCARRPLTTLELEHAIAIEAWESQFDEENLCRVEDMASVCAGLVTVDEESGIVRLVHYTTQEYFERTQSHWFPNVEVDITTKCITYLSFDVFELGYCQTDAAFEERLKSNPFFEYATRNWGYHARKVTTLSQALSRAILSFLVSEAKVNASTQGLLAIKRYLSHTDYSQEIPRKMVGLHLTAYLGVEAIVKLLLEAGKFSVDSEETWGRTPLWLAAENGHEAVVKLLLETGKVDPDSKDRKYGRTPLLQAAKNGYNAIVKLLLETVKVEVDSKDKDDRTPLSYATENGCEAIVKLLLETDKVYINSQDSGYRQTPLSYAAESGHETVIKLLLEVDNIDANLQDEDGRSPLSLAAGNGHAAAVKLLLGIDNIDTDSQDEYGRTPLSWAAGKGYEAIVKLLLETGKADVDSKDKEYSQTPLSRAAENGHEAVVELLLETGKVDVNSKDDTYGRTPLSWAAGSGYKAVVKLLLETDEVDVDSEAEDSRTPLWWAAGNGHKAIVKLLLETGKVDVDSKDQNGRTPLSGAIENGHEAIVKLLVETGMVDIESKDEDDRTPFLWAARNGYEAIVKLLLKTGQVGTDLKDKDGRTPLSWAASNGEEATIKLLLATGKVDTDSKDKDGRTPLSYAAKDGHEAVVKLLLEKGNVDTDSKDSNGRTPLSWTAGSGEEAIAKLLLKTGRIDADSKDKAGRTPLSWAARNGYETIVRVLLEIGEVDIDSKGKDGRTPLSWAAGNGYKAIVKLLLETCKVDINSEDEDGRTPLSWATSHRHEAIVRLLGC